MKLQKFYDSFAGLDTRSNAMVQPEFSIRRGSKNVRYNFQNELTKSNGFQHKSDTTPSTIEGVVEYKFKDINTGQSKNEVLVVCRDGNLYKKLNNYLKFTALGTVTSYSLHYNDVSLDWEIILVDNGVDVTVSFDDTTTMSQLATAIEAATTATVIVVDDDGTTVASTYLAYLLTVVDSTDIVANETTKELAAWDWEIVVFPQSASTVPFPTTRDFYNDPSYEGVSYINLNNVCYITDGGFPMKYDGFQVYRMGMPETLQNIGLTFNNSRTDENFSGQEINGATIAGGALTASGTYKYILQRGFIDANGADTVGRIEGGESLGYIVETLTGGQNSFNIDTGQGIGENFPVWSATVNGAQNLTTTGGTITVQSGHNIDVGMLLRIPVKNAIAGSLESVGFSYIMSYVSAVTATTITVDFGPDTSTLTKYIYPFQEAPYVSSGTFAGAVITGLTSVLANVNVGDSVVVNGATTVGTVLTRDSDTQVTMTAAIGLSGTFTVNFCTVGTILASGEVVQGGYAADFYKNKITDIISDRLLDPEIHFGAYLRIWRSENGGDLFYKVYDVALGTGAYVVNDYVSDANLGTAYLDAPVGGDLPRACKYLGAFQNQIIQAGRPVDPTIVEDFYPGSIGPFTNSWGSESTTYTGWLYGENSLCDFQSYYWNDVNNPEGFPQSGLYENSVETTLSDQIKGLGTNKDALFVFKNRTTAIVTGALAVGEINQEIFEEDIGCANHRTIANVDGSLVWLDAINGFYSCVAGRLPTPISYSINDEFKINPDDLDFNKSFAQNFELENLYVCVIDSKLFVMDYAKTSNSTARLAWYEWDNLDARALLATANDEFLLFDTDQAWQMKLSGTRYDYSNHTSAIDMKYITAWQTYGLPTIDKHFVRVWINSIQGDFELTVSEYVNFNDTAIADYTLSFPAQSGSKLAVKEYIKCAYPKASSYSLQFENNENQEYVRIQGFEIELMDEYLKAEPRT